MIGFVEITKAGQLIVNATFEPFLVYDCVAGLYFALCFPLSLQPPRGVRAAAHADRLTEIFFRQ